jgi:hypothetical protein
MTSLPQQVTIRYAGNLIRKGENNNFRLCSLSWEGITHDDILVGRYYIATIISSSGDNLKEASGITPYQAVERALTKHGVTFRQYEENRKKR